MTLEPPKRKVIPNLNASNDEWKKYWNSCSIGELVSTLGILIQMDRRNKPIENKFLYIRALECKEAISKTVGEIINKNDKLINDIELGKKLKKSSHLDLFSLSLLFTLLVKIMKLLLVKEPSQTTGQQL